MKLKIWEVALTAAVVISLLTVTFISSEQEQLSESLIRLHIVANSDSEYDQNMKLIVRDAVLEKAQELTQQAQNAAQAGQILTDNLDEIASVASDTALQYGYDAATTLQREYFPTRDYDTFSLPAGEYMALRVTIGQGQGRNWWCVVFPPLCISAAEEEQFTSAALTQQQENMITGKNSGYIIKFKITELLGQLKNALNENF